MSLDPAGGARLYSHGGRAPVDVTLELPATVLPATYFLEPPPAPGSMKLSETLRIAARFPGEARVRGRGPLNAGVPTPDRNRRTVELVSGRVDRGAGARGASSGLAPGDPDVIETEGSEQERTVTRRDPAGNGEPTTTHRTATVTPLGSRIQSAVWLVVGIVDVALALDFVFKLLAAANVGFVGFISDVAGSLSAPFRGVLATSAPSGHYFAWPDVVAVVVYSIAALVVVILIRILAGRRSPQTSGA
jgi:hypothetical protein